MAIPKSVTKIKKGNVEFTSNVDRINYTIDELARAALRDIGKYICNKFRTAYYKHFKRRKRRVSKYTQYWVRKRECDLQVGLKPQGFYGGFQEVGARNIPKLGILSKVTEENIDTITNITAQYLGRIEDENTALGSIDENEYEGG